MRSICIFLGSLLLPLPMLAVVDGFVITESGTPVEHARVAPQRVVLGQVL